MTDHPPAQHAANEPLILGFDIGGTKTTVVLGTLAGRILDWYEFASRPAEAFDTMFAGMTAAADQLVAAAQQRGWEAPRAISVAVGGPLDIERGIIFSPPHLPTWDQVPLKARLEAHYPWPVFVEHDGNAGALAEFYCGAGQGKSNVIFLTMGTGLGAGLILNGHIYHGTSSAAGEVGHMRMSETGPVEYGKAGSWESYSSGAGMAKLARLREPELWPAEVTTQQIVQSALAGEAHALRLVQEVGNWLGKGLAILADILNPDMIIVGTLGVVLGDLLLEPARAVLRQEALPLTAEVCQVVPAKLGRNLGKVSALMAAVDAYRTGRLSFADSSDENLVLATLRAGLGIRQRLIETQYNHILATGQLLVKVLRAGNKVLLCGNGGSAATAQHLAGELIGRYKINRVSLPAIALTADTSVLTCIGNDYAFDEIFARPVRALAQPGDLLIGFTTSGRSPNVLSAFRAAQEAGIHTIALTGERGLAESVAAHVIQVPSNETARIQEEHDAIVHAWCEMIDHNFAPV
jgi:phosphoheptose isomerase